ncbi:hypothetical protein JCM5353_000297 [Sporobolomyces roseus]
MSTSRPSRLTTPLRRISSHSLRSLSLSHSQSRDPTSTSESPLSHLSPLFAELADSISDFVANAEGLSQLTANLNKFNQGFSSYLYGLRTNSYTFDFNNLPDKINFNLAEERKHSHFLQQQQQEQAQSQYSPPSSPSQDDRTTGTTSHVGDSTFVTNDEQSFTQDHTPRSTSAASSRGGRGGSGIARGRGRGRGGAGGGAVVTKRKKEEISAFADPVFPLLPINLRENRRTECEKVLWALKEHPLGIGLGDLTKHLSTFPSVPQVRINEVLLALVRAKVATKSLIKVGLNSQKSIAFFDWARELIGAACVGDRG